MGVFTPDRYYTNVQAIDLDDLRSLGVRALLLDLDNTLLPRNSAEMRRELNDWTERMAGEGFALCIVSNNWHERVKSVADSLGLPIVSRALKPFPHAFRRAMELLQVAPAETAVVGDQVFTDVLGGNLIGATTVLVDPLTRSDLPHTLLLRLIEARIMADREPLA